MAAPPVPRHRLLAYSNNVPPDRFEVRVARADPCIDNPDHFIF